MTRTYTLGRRAAKQAETRRRVVQAAVDLHGSVGPARTTLSMVAERAGVQRHTLYAHFPDERSLLMACSSHALEHDPLPDPAAWRLIEDPNERLRAGLTALYGWYERNADLTACVLRDSEFHPLTREVVGLRMEPVMASHREALGAKLTAKQRPLLEVALGFFTWRSLVQGSGLKTAAAVRMMVHAVAGAAQN